MFGKSGQVSSSLQLLAAQQELELIAVPSGEVDIRDVDDVFGSVEEANPDIVVNPAAYTAVDAAESNTELAFAMNGDGAGNVARAASKFGKPVIHISTDYVFDGKKETSYSESDSPSPVSVYGKSKFAGEQMVAALNPAHVILRTSWIFSPYGRNFLKSMLNLARDKDEISVVADQFGNPTAAKDVAGAVLSVSESIVGGASPYGIYNFCGSERKSWADFATEIMAASFSHGGPFARIVPITTADYPTDAKRPVNSSLDMSKFSSKFGYRPEAFRDSVDQVVKSVLEMSEN